MTERIRVRLQAASSLVFLAFLVPHLLSQGAAIFGPGRYEQVLAMFRSVSQWPPFEGAVLGSLLLHSGVSVLGLKRRGLRRAGVRAWAHFATGGVLLVFFAGHVFATRGASAFYGVGVGFEGLAFTLRWKPSFFWPYYVLLGVSGALHAGLGLPGALAVYRPTWSHRTRSCGLAMAAVLGLASTCGVLAFGGAFFEVGHPERGAYALLLTRLGLAD